MPDLPEGTSAMGNCFIRLFIDTFPVTGAAGDLMKGRGQADED
jgi:hypothetical protein